MIDAVALGCQEFVELVTAYLEGALDAADQRRFDEHLGRLRQLHAVPRADPPDDPRSPAPCGPTISLRRPKKRCSRRFADWRRS